MGLWIVLKIFVSRGVWTSDEIQLHGLSASVGRSPTIRLLLAPAAKVLIFRPLSIAVRNIQDKLEKVY